MQSTYAELKTSRASGSPSLNGVTMKRIGPEDLLDKRLDLFTLALNPSEALLCHLGTVFPSRLRKRIDIGLESKPVVVVCAERG